MAAYDDLDVKRIFSVAVISVVVTAVTALAVQVLYYSMKQWQDTETSQASSFARENRILQEQSDQISIYGVDEQTGRITIPIDKAIELVVADSGKQDGNDAKAADHSGSRDTGGSEVGASDAGNDASDET